MTDSGDRLAIDVRPAGGGLKSRSMPKSLKSGDLSGREAVRPQETQGIQARRHGGTAWTQRRVCSAGLTPCVSCLCCVCVCVCM